MAQEMGFGKVPGIGIWDGSGNISKKNPIRMGFSIWDQYSLFLGWISGRSDQIIRGQNFAIVSTASECAQILTRLFRANAPYLFCQKVAHSHSQCRSLVLNSCQVRLCDTPLDIMLLTTIFFKN